MSGVITYLPMALSSLGMVLIFIRPGESSGILMWVAIGMMLLSAVGMLISQFIRAAGDRKRRLRGERRDYLRYLATSRRRIRKAIDEQRRADAWHHPEPGSLVSLARGGRLWERRTTHEDFAEIRVATGTRQLALTLNPLSTKPVEDLEPLCAHALRRFIRAYSTVPGQPIAVRMRSFARVILLSGSKDGEETGPPAPTTPRLPSGTWRPPAAPSAPWSASSPSCTPRRISPSWSSPTAVRSPAGSG